MYMCIVHRLTTRTQCNHHLPGTHVGEVELVHLISPSEVDIFTVDEPCGLVPLQYLLNKQPTEEIKISNCSNYT